MSTATLPTFNRLSAITSWDGAIASFDIAPKQEMNQSDSIEFPDSDLSFIANDYYLFDVPSNHSRGKNHAYLVKKIIQSYIEYPSSFGVPINYGGIPRVRFKALASTMADPEPFLMVPSFGLGMDYNGRAKSLEFWINAEPYAKLTKTNALPKSVFGLEGNDGDYTVNSGTMTKLLPRYEYPSQISNTFELSAGTDVLFADKFAVSGGKHYRFSFKATSTIDTDVSIQIETQGFGEYVGNFPIVGHPSEFNSFFSPEFSSVDFKDYEFEFFVSETVPTVPARLRIVTTNGVQITELKLMDLSSVNEAPAVKQKLLEIYTGKNKSIVLEVDPHFFYLKGYGQRDNFQISEWARPMYIVCVDGDKTFDIYIDTVLSMSIQKNMDTPDEPPENLLGDVVVEGEWIFFFLSPVLKYIDISTVSLYINSMREDIQKIHYMFSYGPSYNDVIMNTDYEKIYVADGSATTFSSRVLFPTIDAFSEGVAHGLNIGGNLSLPDYKLPILHNTTYADIPINTVNDIRYGPNNFIVPENAEMQLRMLDIDTFISHIFIGVSPKDIDNATICRIQSPNFLYVCDVKMEVAQASPKTFRLSGEVVFIDGSGEAPITWWEAEVDIPDSDFVLCLNVDVLKVYADEHISKLFSDSAIVLTIWDQIPIRYISCTSTAMINANNILLDDANALAVNAAGIGTLEGIDVLGKSTYTVYASDTELDIAAAGYWTVSLPLANFATFVEGKPDIDFILYFDQLQSPQFVSGLAKDVMSYKEVEEYVRTEIPDLALNPDTGEYEDMQIDQTGKPYGSVGVDVDTSVPSLGRFVDSNISTYVTLDSPVRWPYKQYSSLKTERATTANFIDFGESPNWVTETKWEIYDGYAIRIPHNITKKKYNIKFAVHLNSKTMNTKRPTFNRFEMYGVASGDSAANTIAVGTGTYLIIGDDLGVNIDKPFSTHLVAENTQSNFMFRENGFYPHLGPDQKMFPVNFYLTDTKAMAGISFYLYWKNETFAYLSPYTDIIAQIRHFVYNTISGENEPVYARVGVETSSDIRYAYQRGNIITDDQYLKIYVDGVLDDGSIDGMLEVGRWHLIHIDFTQPRPAQFIMPPDTRVVKLSLLNDKCVVNYIASHKVAISPPNLFASRFGLTDYTVFDIDADDTDMTVGDKASVQTLNWTPPATGAEADMTLEVTY